MTTTYTVRQGDNLSTIAKQHNISVKDLAELNNIKDVNKIKVGQKLIFEKEEPKQPVTNPQISNEELMSEMERYQQQLADMQQQMTNFQQNEGHDIGGFEMFGYGLAGAAAFKGAEYLAPYAKSAAETAYLKGLYTADKVKAGTNKIGSAIKSGVKHAAKKAELEYAFGKDAIMRGGKKVVGRAKHAGQVVANNVQTAGHAVADGSKQAVRSVAAKGKSIVNATKNTAIKSGRIMKLTKAGKAVGKRLPGVGALIATAEVACAYGEGGTKAAVKQAGKSGSGLAAGAAGTKLGAAIGTAICPGIGTAVGAVVGGIAGYVAGEAAFDKICSWFS